MLARLVPKLEELLQRHLQASLRRPFQTFSSIRFANDQHWPDIGDRMAWSVSGAAGPTAERIGD